MNNINEHDMTKKMMEVIRNGFKNKSLIYETQEFENTENDEELKIDDDDQKDTLTVTKKDAVFIDELKKLQDIVCPRVEITNFKIYPLDQNVIIEGIFLKGKLLNKQEESTPNKKYEGIYFKLSITDGYQEPEIINVKGDTNTSNILKKFPGYYENWVNEWALKIANEYKPKEY